MAVAQNYISQVSAVQSYSTSDIPDVNTGDNTISRSGYNTSKTLNATSSPAISKYAGFRKTLSSGSASLDFRTLVDALGTIDLNTLKVVVLKFKAGAANGAGVSAAAGASTGWDSLGSDFKVTLKAGMEATFYLDTQGVAVSATKKIIDIAGTGSSDYLDISISAG